jgi:tRNA 2-thiocytidine biosynthesis protein TtcA
MDANLFDFKGLRTTGEADPNGDIAFDEDPCSTETSTPAEGATIQFRPFDEI